MSSNMNILKCVLVLALTKLLCVLAKAPFEVVFLIRSHEAPPQNQLSKHLKENITRQSFELQPDYNIKVHIVHELFNYPGEWSILHLIPHLMSPTKRTTTTKAKTKQIDNGIELITNATRWIVFCEDTTSVNVLLLMQRLNAENHTQPMFLGHALYDQEPTIIHHFAFYENPKWFPYPMLRAGIALSLPLLKSIADTLINSNGKHLKEPILRSEFSIDAAHELAHFIYEKVPHVTFDSSHPGSDADTKVANTSKYKRINLKKASYICPAVSWATGSKGSECAMHAASATSPMSCDPVKREQIYFAVKTCSKFHYDRLPMIKSTWAQYAKHIRYYSDVQDDKIPTINTGVPNAEMGHCEKTVQILKLALKDIENYNNFLLHKRLEYHHMHHHKQHRLIQWLLLVDDDTLLSVAGVCQVLGCYDASDEIYLGERYGYRLHAPDGFNYITGGGGIALSLPVAKLIVQHCNCPSPSAPDDMILGSCLHSLQLKALHSPRFHQARPIDYSLERLELDAPISFHKFWQLDAIDVYRQWFFDHDDRLLLMEANDVSVMEDGYHHPNNRDVICYQQKNRNILAQLIDGFVPASVIASLHHSKGRHVDL